MLSRRVFLAVLTIAYVFFLGWFLKLYLLSQTDGTENLLTNFYGLIPLAGGFYGLFISKLWGGAKSSVGRGIIFLALGLITWGIGITIWLYYNFVLQVEVPYPSWADAGFILSWPLWGIGIFFLSKATGAKFGLQKKAGKALLLLIPIIIIIFSYYVLVVIARGGTFEIADNFLTVFFDLAYPIGDVVILTLATLIYGLSYKYFGGRYRYAIYLILLGFVLNYFADFTFSYTTTTESYYNGSLADVFFVSTMYALSMGLAFFDTRKNRLVSAQASNLKAESYAQ